MENEPWNDFWLSRLALNLVGYATIALPAALLVVYGRRRYAEMKHLADVGLFGRLLTAFAVGRPDYTELRQHVAIEDGTSSDGIGAKLLELGGGDHWSQRWKRQSRLLFCFFGLQFNYIVWGWLQEMMMTQPYARNDATGEDRFGDSQFLVFLNRLFAFVLSGCYILVYWRSQPAHTLPLYMYSFASLANIMSSWCQYEALKYVSFPTQTICKASKIIPVMLMGRLVSGTKYTTQQYCIALVLAVGVGMFLLSTDAVQSHKRASQLQMTTVSGLLLICGYLIFDAFTPNWQAALYAYKPRISSYQMMCGVNVYSSLFCIVSLVEFGRLLPAIQFLLEHYTFARDCILMSIFAAVGQIFIFITIEQFGPVTFTIMMTVRQVLSIIVSTAYYGHEISTLGIIGLAVAFASLFASFYFKQRK